jgi:phosphoenolpyruvate carboxykinase (diphosphate)
VMDDGRVTSNPRYLQDRPDLVNHRDTYIARRGMQLHRALPADAPVPAPVGAVLSGRRNNPPEREAGIRSLAIYSPLHYQELPELVMDYVCSLTGKSPSTTGAGSEGALTKGPFNCLLPAIDLNALIVSMILTELGGFSTAAGHIGPNFNVGHDISLLIPEVWCRMTAEERDPNVMIAKKMLEKVPDFQHNGASIPASRLGYRITRKFVRTYLARVFDNPGKVLTDEILRPELQDLDSYADGVMQVVESQQKVAQKYFEDGGFEIACPPLRAVLAIMAQGHHEGKSLDHPQIRSLFTKESLLSSDWYRRRLKTKAVHDQQHWQSFVERLEHSIKASENEVAVQLGLAERLRYAKERLAEASSPSYLDSLVGTIGLDPMVPSLTDPSMLNKLA